MEFLKQNKKWIGLLGCALVVIACFMPFAKATLFGFSQSVTLMDEGKDGIFFIIAAAVSAVLIFKGEYKASLIPSFIGVALNIFEIADINDNGLGIVKVAIGAYLIFVGFAMAIVSAFVKEN